jgi:predicted phosphodiesterase
MRLVCISDTHLRHVFKDIPIPDGDVLIHCGDATFTGKLPEIATFADWFARQPHQHKIFVAGNHDFGFQFQREEAIAALPKGVHYLEDSGVTIDHVKF